MAMSTLMKREGRKAMPHGFRATFRTWRVECTDTPFEMKEAALGHSVDEGVARGHINDLIASLYARKSWYVGRYSMCPLKKIGRAEAGMRNIVAKPRSTKWDWAALYQRETRFYRLIQVSE